MVNIYESYRSGAHSQNTLRLQFETFVVNKAALKALIGILNLPLSADILAKSVSFADSFDLAKIGACEKLQRLENHSASRQDKLHSFIKLLKMKDVPLGIDSYKHFFSDAQANHAILLLKASSPAMHNLYFSSCK